VNEDSQRGSARFLTFLACRSVTEETATGDTELFQLLRSDFEDIMLKFPVLKSRLASIGLARVKRQAKIVKMVSSEMQQDEIDNSMPAGT